MPVCFVKASRVGRDLVLSSTSMYSVQFDQLMIFSVSDMSVAAAAAVFSPRAVPPAPDDGFFPADPQAARKAAAPTPAAPIMAERRDTRPRMQGGPQVGLSLSKSLSFMGSLAPGVSSGSRWRGSTLTRMVLLVGCRVRQTLAPPGADGAWLTSRCWP